MHRFASNYIPPFSSCCCRVMFPIDLPQLDCNILLLSFHVYVLLYAPLIFILVPVRSNVKLSSCVSVSVLPHCLFPISTQPFPFFLILVPHFLMRLSLQMIVDSPYFAGIRACLSAFLSKQFSVPLSLSLLRSDWLRLVSRTFDSDELAAKSEDCLTCTVIFQFATGFLILLSFFFYLHRGIN